MEKFWNWMKENEHRGYFDLIEFDLNDDIPEQMLIGYMIEYLIEIGCAHKIKLVPCELTDFNIDNYYAWVKKFVEKI